MRRPSAIEDRLFWLASPEEIKRGETTDIYFRYAVDTLKKARLNPRVLMEVYVRELPEIGRWGVLTGIFEVAKLLEGLPVNVRSLEEGEIFLVDPDSAVYEPLLQIEGRYTDFAVLETPLLGLLGASTSVSTKAARIRLAAGDKQLFSFGTRRMHPALAPTIERAAYIGGFDGVSNVLGARLMGKDPVGTMPHSLIQCFGDQKAAWQAFDKAVGRNVPRVALIDTFSDEKTEAIMALETLGKQLDGVRLDTPASRRGYFRKIVEEVKWELKIRGGERVKIFISGSLNEEDIRRLADLVDGFGVGTKLSAAPIIDFSAKIVQVERKGAFEPRAKRGGLGGEKQVYRNIDKFEDIVTTRGSRAPAGYSPLLTDLIRNGKLVRREKDLDSVRATLLSKLKVLGKTEPELRWT